MKADKRFSGTACGIAVLVAACLMVALAKKGGEPFLGAVAATGDNLV